MSIGDSFMFGPALLVSPVTDYKVRSRSVYLPAAAPGTTSGRVRPSPADTALMSPRPTTRSRCTFALARSCPLGPELQYTGEKPAGPLTLYVYAGADGRFTLYEDDGASFAYEKGAASEIPFAWREATRTLSIGARQGSFTGMSSSRTFNVVLVDRDHPAGAGDPAAAGRSTLYDGRVITVRF